MSDPYRAVTTRFRGVAPSGKAFFVAPPYQEAGSAGRATGKQETVSIAFSLVHAADERAIAGLFVGEEITFRLMDWKAEEIGFA